MTIRLKQRVAIRRRVSSGLSVRPDKLKDNMQRFQTISSGSAQRASASPPPPPAFGSHGGAIQATGAARSAPVGEILPPNRSGTSGEVWNKAGGIVQQIRSELKHLEQEENKEIAGAEAEYRRIFKEEQGLAMQAAAEAQKLSERAVAEVQKREESIAAETVQRMQSLQQQTVGMLSRAMARQPGMIGKPVAAPSAAASEAKQA